MNPRFNLSVRTLTLGLCAITAVTNALKAEDRKTHMDTTGGAWLAAGRFEYTISVPVDGWYRVPKSALRPDLNFDQVALFHHGVEVAAQVSDDALFFYGHSADTAATDFSVYWLQTDARAPRRIAVRSPTQPPSSVIVNAYQAEFSKQYRSIFLAPINNGDDDNFFGPVVTHEGIHESIVLQNIHAEPPFEQTLSLKVQGVSATHHALELKLNNTTLGSLNFEGVTPHNVSFSLPPGLLVNGNNILKLTRTSGNNADAVCLDAVSIGYGRLAVADADTLELKVNPGRRMVIAGFSTPSIKVLDITHPAAPEALPAKIIRSAGSYAVEVDVVGMGVRRLLATAQGAERSSPSLSRFQHGDTLKLLNSSTTRGDMVIVSHERFISGIDALASLRRSEGLGVVVVPIQAAYDAFSFGEKDPKAISALIEHAHMRWMKPPRFLLLVGDASIDPRNRLGRGDFDFVPTQRIHTQYGEAAWDDGFVDLNRDGFPEVALGRLPARTTDDLNAMVSKILRASKRQTHEPLRALFVSDIADDFPFEERHRWTVRESADVAEANFVTRTEDPVQTFGTIHQSLVQGMDIIGYMGHGSVELWRGRILDATRVEQLPANVYPPLFLNITCLNGAFDDVVLDSLAERLLRLPGSGASAVWASTGFTGAQSQVPIYAAALQHLTRDKLPIGEAFRLAKRAAFDVDVRHTWTLFGDPSMRLWNEQSEEAFLPQAADNAPDPHPTQTEYVRPGGGGCTVFSAHQGSRSFFALIVAILLGCVFRFRMKRFHPHRRCL